MLGQRRKLRPWLTILPTIRMTWMTDNGAGLFRLEDLSELPLFGPTFKQMRDRYPALERERMMNEIVREVIGLMVGDLLETTRHRLGLLKPQTVEDIRRATQPIVGFSFAMAQNIEMLRGFLHQRMYKHMKVNRICARARHIVKDLFGFFMAEPNCMPNAWFDLVQAQSGDHDRARVIADYIAGMTDRFAMREHAKLFGTDGMG